MARNGGKPVLEWVAASLGALITLALLGFIALEAFSTSREVPAAVTIEARDLHATAGGFVLQVEAVNHSRQTAAALHIQGELEQGGEAVESSEATISYVPGNSRRDGALVFTKDPRRYRLSLRVLGYEDP